MSQELYLNIGCGKVKLPNFINIDREPGGDLQCDVTNGLPYADATVDGIYSEHFIEHLPQKDIMAFLRECRRVLKPGGRVRIATPDLDEIVRQYAENDWKQPWFQKYGYEWIVNRAECLNIVMREWGHAWLVNEQELSRLAAMAGLEQSQRCNLNISSDLHLENIETRTESTLIMEFFKRVDIVSDDPLVSIIIPAYRPDFFISCLESALAQTHQSIEVLVLDESSGDEIEKITCAYRKSDARIMYWRNIQPLGEPASLMRGIRLARGEFIKPLYDDDLLEPDAIEHLLSAFRAEPDARLASGRRLFINTDGHKLNLAISKRVLSRTSRRLHGTTVMERLLTTGANLLGEPTCMLFRHKDALAIDEPNLMTLFGRLCFGVGDVCLAFHLLSRGDIVYLADPIAKLRVHPGQTQQQAHMRETALLSMLYLRQQGVRMGFRVPRRALLINKLLLKYERLYHLVKAKRLIKEAIHRLTSP